MDEEQKKERKIRRYSHKKNHDKSKFGSDDGLKGNKNVDIQYSGEEKKIRKGVLKKFILIDLCQ